METDKSRTYLGGSARARIEAPAERLWAIVADPTRHPELAGSGEPQETSLLTEGPLRVGSQFRSRQKVRGMRYTSTSTVTACQEPRLLRWNLDGKVDWEYRFEPLDGNATRAVHGYRWDTSMPGPISLLLGPLFRWRDRQIVSSMTGTLRNLARLAGAPEPTAIEVSRDVPVLADTV